MRGRESIAEIDNASQRTGCCDLSSHRDLGRYGCVKKVTFISVFGFRAVVGPSYLGTELVHPEECLYDSESK